MANSHGARSALRKSSIPLTRRTLLALHERERREAAEDLRYEVARAIEAINTTVLNLRKNYGLALPYFRMQWDPVPTQNPTPAHTLDAYAGDCSAVRVSIALDPFDDDTSEAQLARHGISHLIGLEVDSSITSPTWKTNADGAMLAKIKVRLDQIAWILHDIFIDMAIIHARGQLWSELKKHLTVAELAAQKVLFARSIGPKAFHMVDIGDEALYIPISSMARINSDPTSIQLDKCIELWTEFAKHLSQTGIVNLAMTRAQIATNILKYHINGGQISQRKLATVIDTLPEGHYRFYFLIRSSNQTKKIAHISHLFEHNPDHFRTQWWVIRARDDLSKLANILMVEGFVTTYPFYIGGTV